MAGATVVPIDTSAPQWKLTPADLRRPLTARSRVLVVCSPCSPAGAVYSDGGLAGPAKVLAEAEMAAVIDEIYARISYVPVGRWLRAAPQLADRSLIVDGVSKAYAMTGWRLGWLVASRDLMESDSTLQSHLTSHPSSITQRAAQFALESNLAVEEEADQMGGIFPQRRAGIRAGLAAIHGAGAP